MKTLITAILLTLSFGASAQEATQNDAQLAYTGFTMCYIYHNDKFQARMDAVGGNDDDEQRDYQLKMSKLFEKHAKETLKEYGPWETDSEVYMDFYYNFVPMVREHMSAYTAEEIEEMGGECGLLHKAIIDYAQ